jgi:hypothetical protein
LGNGDNRSAGFQQILRLFIPIVGVQNGNPRLDVFQLRFGSDGGVGALFGLDEF